MDGAVGLFLSAFRRHLLPAPQCDTGGRIHHCNSPNGEGEMLRHCQGRLDASRSQRQRTISSGWKTCSRRPPGLQGLCSAVANPPEPSQAPFASASRLELRLPDFANS